MIFRPEHLNIELSWSKFSQLDGIRDLPLHEQTRQYSFYLESLENQRINQNKGPNPFEDIEEGALLLESGGFLLQENGNKIIL